MKYIMVFWCTFLMVLLCITLLRVCEMNGIQVDLISKMILGGVSGGMGAVIGCIWFDAPQGG